MNGKTHAGQNAATDMQGLELARLPGVSEGMLNPDDADIGTK